MSEALLLQKLNTARKEGWYPFFQKPSRLNRSNFLLVFYRGICISGAYRCCRGNKARSDCYLHTTLKNISGIVYFILSNFVFFSKLKNFIEGWFAVSFYVLFWVFADLFYHREAVFLQSYRDRLNCYTTLNVLLVGLAFLYLELTL